MKIKAIGHLFFLAALAAASLSHGSDFVDDFANADNITPDGNITSSANNGILTLKRTEPEGDALVDWMIDGTTRFSLDPADKQNMLRITPSAAIGNGEWSVFILFFNDEGTYVGAKELIAFTNDTAPVIHDINAFASAEGVTDADSYFVRIWIQGSDDTRLDFSQTGFEFKQFAVISESSE